MDSTSVNDGAATPQHLTSVVRPTTRFLQQITNSPGQPC